MYCKFISNKHLNSGISDASFVRTLISTRTRLVIDKLDRILPSGMSWLRVPICKSKVDEYKDSLTMWPNNCPHEAETPKTRSISISLKFLEFVVPSFDSSGKSLRCLCIPSLLFSYWPSQITWWLFRFLIGWSLENPTSAGDLFPDLNFEGSPVSTNENADRQSRDPAGPIGALRSNTIFTFHARGQELSP